jgi:ferric-dicitrate binding protein FerR (iron transport regulator)
MAVASDQELVDSAQAQADALGESFAFAESSFYAQSSVTVTMLSGDVSLDVSGYLKTAEHVLTAGAESDFYRTSPVGECFFTQECYE